MNIAATTQTTPGHERHVSRLRRIIDLSIAIVLIVLLMQFAVGNLQSFEVISRSMDPTLKIGDRVLLVRDEHTSHLAGKVIAFEPPGQGTALTKRVLAEDGGKVELRNGRLYVDGQPEHYGKEPIHLRRPRSWDVGENQMFVAGDNRNNSYDSVDHGPISRNKLMGVLTFRYWPPERIGMIN